MIPPGEQPVIRLSPGGKIAVKNPYLERGKGQSVDKPQFCVKQNWGLF